MDEKCQFLSLHASYLPIQVLKTSLVRPAFLIDFQKIKNFDWKKKTFNGPKSIKNFKLNAFFLDEFQFTHIGQSKSNSRTNFNESCLFVTKKVFLRYIQTQSHYREVARWEIFMEQELRFGLDLGPMANFPAFIPSKSFDLSNHHVPPM